MSQIADNAAAIAAEANTCCHRSDGYEQAIKQLALKCLHAAYKQGYDDARRQFTEYPDREDMGR